MNIARAHHLSVFLLCVWGITALFLTGEFSIFVVAIAWVLQAVAYRASLRGVRIEPVHVNILTLTVFLGVVILALQSLLDAAIYFFVYLQIAKLVTMRSSRDAFWIYITAFFQVVGSAVLTTSVAFVVIFAVYVLLMVYSLLLQNARKGAEIAARRAVKVGAVSVDGTVVAAPPAWTQLHLPGGRRTPFLASTITLTIFVVTISIGFFFVVPRLSSQTIIPNTSQAEMAEAISAFDESVEFGAFGTIGLNPTPALYVRPLSGERPHNLRLRGTALDFFDGARWTRTTPPIGGPDRRQPFSRFNRAMHDHPVGNFRIIQPAGVTNYLFAPTFGQKVEWKQEIRLFYDPVSNAIWLPEPLNREVAYDVESRVENLGARTDPVRLEERDRRNDEEAARDLVATLGTAASAVRQEFREATRRALGPDSGGPRPRYSNRPMAWEARRTVIDELRLESAYRSNCLAIPAIFDRNRLAQFAQTMAGDAQTPFQKAMAIERELQTQYEYTLERRVSGPRHVEDFLYEVRAGHCEYFATGMTMLMRSLGIPARIVNGYVTAEWNTLAESYIVRQSDAHSWVEVYFDNYGWMTFDPTPPSGVARPPELSALAQAYNRILDSLKINWYRYVIDYDIEDQAGVARTMWAVPRILSRLARNTRGALPDLMNPAGGQPGFVMAAALGIAVTGVALAYLLLANRIGRRRKRGAMRHPLRKGIVTFYNEILRLLKRRGHTRKPAETPAEFASRVSDQAGLEELPDITGWYYENRYDHSEIPEPRKQRIFDFTRRLRDKK